MTDDTRVADDIRESDMTVAEAVADDNARILAESAESEDRDRTLDEFAAGGG